MRSRVGSANARNMTLMRRTALVARVSTFVAVAARPFTSLAAVRPVLYSPLHMYWQQVNRMPGT